MVKNAAAVTGTVGISGDHPVPPPAHRTVDGVAAAQILHSAHGDLPLFRSLAGSDVLHKSIPFLRQNEICNKIFGKYFSNLICRPGVIPY